MSDDDFGLDDLVTPSAPPTARAGSNGSTVDPDLRAAAAYAAGQRSHPELDEPWPDVDDRVPDYADDAYEAAERPLELIRYDRLPTEQPPEAGVLFRPDGRGLFYMAAVNSIGGDPGVGKTFAALLAVLAAIAQGLHVLLIDYEDTPGRLRARLISLGVTEAQLALVHGVKDPDRLYPGHVDQLIALIQEHAIAVVVIDSVTEALEAHDLDENAGGDYSRWFRTIPKLLARAGPAVILIDHRPKPSQSVRGANARGVWAVGSRHKLAAADLSYILEERSPFSRAEPGRTGKLDLMVAKDKHGSIGGRGDLVARFEITPTTEGAITHEVGLPPNRTELADDGSKISNADRLLMQRTAILPLIHATWERDLAEDHSLEGLSTNRLVDMLRTLPLEKRPDGRKLEGRADAFRAAFRAWADAGYLEHLPGPRRGDYWRPINAQVRDLFHPDPEPFPVAEPELDYEDEEPF